jgi:hypothetical protein
MKENMKLLVETSTRLQENFQKAERDCVLMVGMAQIPEQNKAGMGIAVRGDSPSLSAVLVSAMKANKKIAIAILMAVEHFMETENNPDGEDAKKLNELMNKAVKATNAEAAAKLNLDEKE